ncbi:PREDICTED: uncharacterized protein LOC104733723 [Camelina sativa]|uniref:Uncharacterized protein LOC104733723 n=1 Tax=Camelina sativa TaxID=90675 RepID=A0ABM0V6E9_CAMSA|nr:PREDICTED: uncharacterized protein LOC104733723 [Camelina sativa]
MVFRDLLLTGHEGSIDALPEVIRDVLWRFADVFPDELPEGLPPIRGIEHQIEFAYNQAVHSSTKKSPFEVAYGFKPLTPLDLLTLPPEETKNQDGAARAELVKTLHEEVRANIEQRNEQYARFLNRGRKPMLFKPGDWVWLHLRPERFQQKQKDKLSPHGDGPFRVIEKINDNAYRLELPGEYTTSTSFNVTDLVSFDVGDDEDVFGTKPFQEGGNDVSTRQEADQDTLDATEMPDQDAPDAAKTQAPDTAKAPIVLPGATTRSRSSAKVTKQWINLFVRSFMQQHSGNEELESSVRVAFTLIQE